MRCYIKMNTMRQVFFACLVFGATFWALSGRAGPGSSESSPPERAGPGIAFLNDRARDITGATVLNIPGYAVPSGLTGEGQTIAIADSGLDSGRLDDLHPDLKNTPDQPPKVVHLESVAGRPVPDDPTGHGTHMAATLAGTGAASGGQFKGVAPEAGIYFQAILNEKGEPEPPSNLNDLFEPAYMAGARVHVDGWGGGANTYGRTATQVDSFVRRHPNFLPVFGAGNDGPLPGTLTKEANSKNALVVGASVLPRPALMPAEYDPLTVASFSSRGPAGDGRLKPELLAPASAVISARSRLVEGNLPGYPQYTQMQGTSMAAAVTGGLTALLMEYFQKEAGHGDPSAALLRAALANGARTASDGPSREGFGVIDLPATVLALKDATFNWADERSGLIQGEEAAFTYTVTDSSVPLKATLAWTDPPAPVGSENALVNDLNLVVQAPDGRAYFGNSFLGGNGQDQINNIEQVYLPAPMLGRYTVRVTVGAIRAGVSPGSSRQAQDFALVWGQPPQIDRLVAADGSSMQLAVKGQVSLGGESAGGSPATGRKGVIPVLNAVDGVLQPFDPAHLYPGAAVYRTSRSIYLAARLWRGVAVGTLKMPSGTVLAEMNRLASLGGYLLEPGGKIYLNGLTAAVENLPPGLEVTASINPTTQIAYRVEAGYSEREGLLSVVRSKDERNYVGLLGHSRTFTVHPAAAYVFEDQFLGADPVDMPFGTGVLDELDKVLPGMPALLHLSPKGGEVQYLAVKRQLVFGTVWNIDSSTGIVRTEAGAAFHFALGTPAKKDGKYISSVDDLSPGDHLAAMLRPGSDEAIGLVAYSGVLYGKVIDFSEKSRTITLLDDARQYRMFVLPPEAVVYRWGLLARTDALTSGSRIRLITGAGGTKVLRIDVAEKFYVTGKLLTRYSPEEKVLIASDGTLHRIDGYTRFYKNGQPVVPEALLPGDQIDLECVAAPPPTGSVLLSVNARTTAAPPQLTASSLALPGRLAVTGKSSAGDLYLFAADGSWEAVPVGTGGRFAFVLPLSAGVQEDLTLVAVERQGGGVAGQTLAVPAGSSDPTASDGSEAVSQVLSALAPEAGNISPPAPLSRAVAVTALGRLLGWPLASTWSQPFKDAQDRPTAVRAALAEAQARGIVSGFPDGSFRPDSPLTRAEAAMLLARTMQEMGLTGDAEVLPDQVPVFGLTGAASSKQSLLATRGMGLGSAASGWGAESPYRRLAYGDVGIIPQWATSAVAETTAAGLFRGRPDGTFAPGEPLTAGEMAVLLDRLLNLCGRVWPDYPDPGVSATL